ncbi:unnamed protein product [Darwinula stevensoni]|uniref:G-protein coupled receptors family 1 profile domain-containing protein n=1 Tax=Darwinula stevensoni TaxID=69355 RepID=A0A7R9ACZ7_9CRUS|nr:unnamed protein product [Darwinula stevensoni]CAG0900803.1 unnamed protein product [Darwinula stevensoni]
MKTLFRYLSAKMVKQNLSEILPAAPWEGIAAMGLEILARTEAHWFQYPPPSSFAHAVVTVLYAIIFFLGVAGNGAVLYLTISSGSPPPPPPRSKDLSRKTNSFLLNLAVSDLLMMFTIPIIVVNSLHEGPVLAVPGEPMPGRKTSHNADDTEIPNAHSFARGYLRHLATD